MQLAPNVQGRSEQSSEKEYFYILRKLIIDTDLKFYKNFVWVYVDVYVFTYVALELKWKVLVWESMQLQNVWKWASVTLFHLQNHTDISVQKLRESYHL